MKASWRIHVKLVGTAPILFDRFSGNIKQQLEPENKVYRDEAGRIVIPSLNIMSFLSAENTESAPRRLLGKEWRKVAKAALSYVTVQPFEIPVTSGGKPATMKMIKIVTHVARLKGGIPNPVQRPQLPLPWELEFDIILYENQDLGLDLLKKLFELGGEQIGLGTFRGLFGKFRIEEWKIVENLAEQNP
jgi:hypothetical protein